MPPVTPQPFGKRNRPSAVTRAAPAPVAGAVTDHAAFFAAAREEIEAPDTRRKIVPRSFGAAILAGLVVGFCLAGLDITQAAHIDPAVAALLKQSPILGEIGLSDTSQALPYMIAFSLLGGARAAATTLLIAHRLLRWAGQSSHLAYAAAGVVVTAAYAGVVLALTGHPPQHGWPIDLAAGAGAGFFYRMFAGAKRAEG